MSLFALGVIILYVVINEIITTFFAKRLFDFSGKLKWGAFTFPTVLTRQFRRAILPYLCVALQVFYSSPPPPWTVFYLLYYMYLYQIYYTFSANWRKFFPRQISNTRLICVILHNPRRKLLFPDNCPPTDISSGDCVFFNK